MRTTVTKTTRMRTGESMTLENLREFVHATEGEDGSAQFAIEVERGQRDAEYYYLVIKEEVQF